MPDLWPDLRTIALSAGSAILAAWGVVRWLASHLIEHRLAKDLRDYQAQIDSQLKDHQSQLDAALLQAKAEFEASLRQRVEDYLGERAAERQYQLDARKRLYTAVGPLKFQLILASSDFVNRVLRIGMSSEQFPITYKGYFGRSTLYRLLRVFGISELIERQIADADFTVDPWMVNLIRCKQMFFECMATSRVSLGHPNENWNEQRQHIFYDELTIISSDMVVADQNGSQQRVMRFDEFTKLDLDPIDRIGRFRALPHILKDFTPTAKPILWVRLLALTSLCNELVRLEGPRVGIEPEEFDGVRLLLACNDSFVLSNRDRYLAMLERVIATIQVSSLSARDSPVRQGTG